MTYSVDDPACPTTFVDEQQLRRPVNLAMLHRLQPKYPPDRWVMAGMVGEAGYLGLRTTDVGQLARELAGAMAELSARLMVAARVMGEAYITLDQLDDSITHIH